MRVNHHWLSARAHTLIQRNSNAGLFAHKHHCDWYSETSIKRESTNLTCTRDDLDWIYNQRICEMCVMSKSMESSCAFHSLCKWPKLEYFAEFICIELIFLNFEFCSHATEPDWVSSTEVSEIGKKYIAFEVPQHSNIIDFRPYCNICDLYPRRKHQWFYSNKQTMGKLFSLSAMRRLGFL